MVPGGGDDGAARGEQREHEVEGQLCDADADDGAHERCAAASHCGDAHGAREHSAEHERERSRNEAACPGVRERGEQGGDGAEHHPAQQARRSRLHSLSVIGLIGTFALNRVSCGYDTA